MSLKRHSSGEHCITAVDPSVRRPTFLTIMTGELEEPMDNHYCATPKSSARLSVLNLASGARAGYTSSNGIAAWAGIYVEFILKAGALIT
jgi:hypothetical protein